MYKISYYCQKKFGVEELYFVAYNCNCVFTLKGHEVKFTRIRIEDLKTKKVSETRYDYSNPNGLGITHSFFEE